MGMISTVLSTSAESRIRELTSLDASVRGPLPLSTRVGFVGVAGGVGTSTAAGLAVSVLVSRRGGRILAVNASSGRRSVLWRAGLTDDASPDPGTAAQRAGARQAADAVQGLARTPGGGYAIDLADADRTTADARWWETVAPVSRFFDFVVTDWGVRRADDLSDVTASSSLVCVTTAADLPAIQHGLDLANTAEGAGTRAVLAVVDTQARLTGALRVVLDRLPIPAVVLPHDLAHAATSPAPSTRLRATTNLGALRLATTLVDRARGRRA
ncbi:hypothetical protein [Georgenia alba]|uniref:MinD-like ATPase involved in chromosome partitioning or flagellar assembly n=1 Tax=Georgenia alba TaxID=2233858 RepID=A0ABW2Q473_9MICO